MSLSNAQCLGAALATGIVTFTLVACGGNVSTVPGTGDDAGGGGGAADGATGPGTPGLDAAIRDGQPPPRDGAVAVCKTDPDCNGVPEISSLLGRCFQGICICNDGFHVQPDGKCSKTLPVPCTPSGKCVQNPATCPGGLLEGSLYVNMTCGDLVAAVCCFDPATCIGPQFTCCGPTDAAHAPICESGYRTCPSGFTPVAPGAGCG